MDASHALMLALLLGMQHGLDPDHLAAIDGLTRYNLARGESRARWCGLWFSLGHGTLVTLATLGVASLASGVHLPDWVDTASGWATIAVLVAIGVANLASVRGGREPDGPSGGPRARVLAGLLSTGHPAAIFSVGALFAISFETLTQASVFALGASAAGGSAAAQSGAAWLPLALGAVFTLGMIVTDSANGLWLFRLASNTRRHSGQAMRRLALAIGLLSLAMAGWAALRMSVPAVDEFLEGSELPVGLGIIALVALCYLLAIRGRSVAPVDAPGTR